MAALGWRLMRGPRKDRGPWEFSIIARMAVRRPKADRRSGVAAFATRFTQGGHIMKAKWDLRRSDSGTGRPAAAGLIKGITMLSSRATAEQTMPSARNDLRDRAGLRRSVYMRHVV